GVQRFFGLQIRIAPLEGDRTLVNPVGEEIKAGWRPESPPHVEYQRHRLGNFVEEAKIAGYRIPTASRIGDAELIVSGHIHMAIVIACAERNIPVSAMNLLEPVHANCIDLGVRNQSFLARFVEGRADSADPKYTGHVADRRMMKMCVQSVI